jgi:hypothetical protein
MYDNEYDYDFILCDLETPLVFGNEDLTSFYTILDEDGEEVIEDSESL